MSDVTYAQELPVGSVKHHALGWNGMLALIATEAALFAYLLFSYYYFVVQYGRSFLPDELPGFRLSAPETAILIASSVTVWWGERGLKHGRRWQNLLGMIAGIILGAAFVGIQMLEWFSKPFTLASTSYSSIYFVVTGFHITHVVGGLIVLIFVTLWSALGYFDRERHAAVSIGSIYWHFVDAVWITVFFTFYITPRLG
jgi:heme/copper-type cytochrome/quinol oxidase subunit 3